MHSGHVAENSLGAGPDPCAVFDFPVRRADALQQAMLAAFDACGRAAVLIDKLQRVLCMNNAAKMLIGDGVMVSQNRLRAATRSADAALQSLLGKVVADENAHCPAGAALPRAGGRPLIAYGVPLNDETGTLFAGAVALVTLNRLDNQISSGAALLAKAYGLTPAEQTLCERLASGGTLPEAATALGVSISTVKTHLKGAFLKTDTHRQSELVALLGQAAYSIWCGSKPMQA